MLKHDINYDLKKQLDEYSDDYSDEDEDTDVPSLTTTMARHQITFSNMPRRPHSHQSTQTCPKIVRRDPLLLQSFKVTEVLASCIVHDRKYLSRFHHLLNLFRCTYDFPNRVYRQLPGSCCSCEGRAGTYCLCASIENS